MEQKSKSMFVKMMMMMASSHDGEALVAIRKANAILAEANVNWEEFLSALDQQPKSDYRTPPSKRQNAQEQPKPSTPWHNIDGDQHTDATEIDHLFERVYARVSRGSSFYEFIQSVHDFWDQKGFLTDAQYQAIRRAATR